MSDNHIPPEIDYLSKDFASFRNLIIDQLALWAPNWQEDHPADLGNALVDLLAYVGDYLSYYQDAVATEAYLGTARRRSSIEHHARLLDYGLHQGCNAWVWVHIPVADRGRDPVPLPRGTKLMTRTEESVPGVLPPNSTAIAHAVAQGALIFETMHSANLYGANNQISFYIGSDPRRFDKIYNLDESPRVWLPEGTCSAVLRDDWLRPKDDRKLHLEVGDVLILEEIINPFTGVARGDPKRRHPVRLTCVTPSMDGGKPVVEVSWNVKDALPFRLCVAVRRQVPAMPDSPDGAAPIETSIAHGNIVLASHGETVADEELSPVAGLRRYYPRMLRRGLTYQVPYDHARALASPAALVRVGDAKQAIPAIQLVELGLDPILPNEDKPPLIPLTENKGLIYPVKDWVVRPELLSSGTFTRDCMVEMQENGDAYLRFGFGEAGWKPQVVNARFIATYRVGMGAIGNVGRESIGHLIAPKQQDSGLFQRPRNPLAAWGGTDRASLEEARLNAPQALHTQLRCVTEADYVGMARRHPEVLNAAVQTRPLGPWPITSIFVQRRNGLTTNGVFIKEMSRFMDQFRIAGRDIEILKPCWVPLEVEVELHVPLALVQAVRASLQNELGNKEFEPGIFGLFYPDNWTFGQKLYKSQVMARASKVTGVEQVQIKFSRAGRELEMDPITVSPIEILKCYVSAVLNGARDFIIVE